MPQVLQDMLQLLKETVSNKHAERLEQIVIALIAIEIGALFYYISAIWLFDFPFPQVLGIITILVDLMAAPAG